MTMEEKTVDPARTEQKTTEEKQPVQDDELWENCKGQCGFSPWCRDCLLQKEKLHEERLNQQRRSDDKKE